MKSIKTTFLLAFVSLGTITAATIQPASAQTGFDMWTENTVDTTNCDGYTSCYVDGFGQVSGSNDAYDPGSFYPEDHTWQKQVEW